jgi:hypothetical protein
VEPRYRFRPVPQRNSFVKLNTELCVKYGTAKQKDRPGKVVFRKSQVPLAEPLLLQPYEHERKYKDRSSADINLLDGSINHGLAFRQGGPIKFSV